MTGHRSLPAGAPEIWRGLSFEDLAYEIMSLYIAEEDVPEVALRDGTRAPALRFIVNAFPSNALQRAIWGDIEDLPKHPQANIKRLRATGVLVHYPVFLLNESCEQKR